MALANYADLQQAVADNLARADLSTYIPDFVTMAENWLNYGSDDVPPLRCREMETVATLTPTNGVCTLPADYLQYQRVVEDLSSRRVLSYMTPDAAEVYYPERAAGMAEHFTIIGTDLYTFPLAQSDVELTYYAALPPLASNSTNWLLTKAPGLYLRAALVQAAEFIKDTDETVKQASLAKALIAGMNRSDVAGKFARAGLVMRGAVA